MGYKNEPDDSCPSIDAVQEKLGEVIEIIRGTIVTDELETIRSINATLRGDNHRLSHELEEAEARLDKLVSAYAELEKKLSVQEDEWRDAKIDELELKNNDLELKLAELEHIP